MQSCQKTSISKKNKLLSFFCQNYNHYDSTTVKEKTQTDDFFITAKQSFDNQLISRQNSTVFCPSSTSLCFPGKADTRKNSLDGQLREILLKTTKPRDFTSSSATSICIEIPKITLPSRNNCSKSPITLAKLPKNRLEGDRIQKDLEKNIENNRNINKHLFFLKESDNKAGMDKQTWKNMVFNKGSLLDLKRPSQEVFNIYSHKEKRHSFINELNYRLHYRKTPNNKKNVQTPPKIEKTKEKTNKNVVKLAKNGKNIEKLLQKNDDLHKMEKQRRLKINLTEKIIKDCNTEDDLGPLLKEAGSAELLPADEKVRYFRFPMLLMQNICENLNYLKEAKSPKFLFNNVDKLCHNNLPIKKSMLDIELSQVIEPITPRSLYMRFLINEKRNNYNSHYEPKRKGSRKSQINSLFFNNPFKKLEKESIEAIAEFREKLEELKISFEKQKMNTCKWSILKDHRSILEEEIRLIQKFKAQHKKPQYQRFKDLLLKRQELNITVPSSDLFKQVKKLGRLSFIRKDHIANLQDFERFLYEMKTSEMSLNDEIQ